MPSLTTKRINFLRPPFGQRRSGSSAASSFAPTSDTQPTPELQHPAGARASSKDSTPGAPSSEIWRSFDLGAGIAPRISSVFRRRTNKTQPASPPSSTSPAADAEATSADGSAGDENENENEDEDEENTSFVDASDSLDPARLSSSSFSFAPARPSYDHRPIVRSRRDPLNHVPQIDFDPASDPVEEEDSARHGRASVESQESSDLSSSSDSTVERAAATTPEAPQLRTSSVPPPQPTLEDPPAAAADYESPQNRALPLGSTLTANVGPALHTLGNQVRVGRSNWVRFAVPLDRPTSRRGSSSIATSAVTLGATTAPEGDYFSLTPLTTPSNGIYDNTGALRALADSGNAPLRMPPPSPSLITVSRHLRAPDETYQQVPADKRRQQLHTALTTRTAGFTPLTPAPSSRQLAPVAPVAPTGAVVPSHSGSRRESAVSTALSLTPTPSREGGSTTGGGGMSPVQATTPGTGSAPASEPTSAPAPAPAPALASHPDSTTTPTTTNGNPPPAASDPQTNAAPTSASTAAPVRQTLRRGMSRSMVELNRAPTGGRSATTPPTLPAGTGSLPTSSSATQQSTPERLASISSESSAAINEDLSSSSSPTTQSSTHATSPDDDPTTTTSRVPTLGPPPGDPPKHPHYHHPHPHPHHHRTTADARSKMRRQSMTAMDTQPPPYTSITSSMTAVLPREEEGKEFLPKYMSPVHLEGYLPRKMEFSGPGVQSRDRSWRRYYFVLHGTYLKVYKGDMSALVPRPVALQAFQPMYGAHVLLEPINEDDSAASNSTPSSSGVAATASQAAQSVARGAFQRHAHVGLHLGSSSNNNNNHNNNSNNTSPLHSTEPNGGAESQHHSAIDHQRKLMAEPSGALLASIKNGSYVNHHAQGNDPFGTNLVKNYSLQKAESGLAADYIKRKHVVRVRVAGEQFLIQCCDQSHVVIWIEALQAATNVALDLDQRAMPKFITLPRRRRRRRAGNDDLGPRAQRDQRERLLAAREAAQIAEAQRRSLSEMGRPTEASLIEVEADVPATLHEPVGEEDDLLVPTSQPSVAAVSSTTTATASRRHAAPRVSGSGMSYRTSHDLPTAQKYNEV